MAKIRCNVQQLPKRQDILEQFVCPPDHVLVELDFCYTADTEILTKRGWLTFDKVTTADEVWQVDSTTLCGSWSTPSRVIWRDYSGDVYEFGNKRGKLRVTSGHRMLWVGQQRHKTRPDKASLRWETRAEGGIPTSGACVAKASYSESYSEYSDHELEMVCMLQADGSVTHETSDGQFSYALQLAREDKRALATKLLGRSGRVLPPRGLQKLDTESWYGIRFQSPLLVKKSLCLSTLGSNQAANFLAALSRWDSSIGHDNTVHFVSIDEYTVDQLQAYFVRCGYEAKKRVLPDRKFTKNTAYELRIRNKLEFRVRPKIDETVSYYEGKIGCVTVPAGYILVRQNGQTFVSGNCSVEPTIAATFSRDPTLLELYASGRAHDVYLFIAAQVDPDPEIARLYNLTNPTKDSVAAAKRYAGKKRAVYKQVHLSAQYGAGAWKIYTSLRTAGVDISLEEVEEAHRKYWQLFSGLKRWESQLLAEREDRGGWVLNGRGLPLCIPDHRVKDIVNAWCQSTGHSLLLTFVWYIAQHRRRLGLKTLRPYLVNLHDETIWQVHKSEQELAVWCFKQALKDLNTELKSDIMIKGDVELGTNLWKFKSG